MARTSAILCLDIEDPITMRSHQATQWITQDISDAGLVGSCFLVAEKVRAWEQLGLRQVIEAVKGHDLHFHSSRHSFHPTISEISESLPAQASAEMLWGWERPGWEATERIMGRPVKHWGLSGGSWSPALAVMLGQHGRALMYSPIYGDDPSRPCWFAGSLNVAEFSPGLCGDFHQDTKFVQAWADYKQWVDQRLDRGVPYLGLFGCHPTRVVHHQFWDDVNFGEGRATTPEKWENPAAITADEEHTARNNFQRFLQWMASEERLEVIGFSDLVQRFSSQKAGCTPRQLKEICQRICEEEAVIFTDSFTAAEILGLMADYTQHPNSDFLRRRELLAPESLPTKSTGSTVDPEHVLAVSAVVQAYLTAARKVPDQVSCGESVLYIADYFVALARAIVVGNNTGQRRFRVSVDCPYPLIGEDLARRATERIRSWSIHRPDLDLQWIERDTCLLSWTYKPAWTKEELSQVQ